MIHCLLKIKITFFSPIIVLQKILSRHPDHDVMPIIRGGKMGKKQTNPRNPMKFLGFLQKTKVISQIGKK